MQIHKMPVLCQLEQGAIETKVALGNRAMRIIPLFTNQIPLFLLFFRYSSLYNHDKYFHHKYFHDISFLHFIVLQVLENFSREKKRTEKLALSSRFSVIKFIILRFFFWNPVSIAVLFCYIFNRNSIGFYLCVSFLSSWACLR